MNRVCDCASFTQCACDSIQNVFGKIIHEADNIDFGFVRLFGHNTKSVDRKIVIDENKACVVDTI